MWPNLQETADLVTFTEEILNGKLHFLCSVSQNDHTGQIKTTYIQLKEYSAKMYEDYALLRNNQGFESELERPKVNEIMELASTLQNSKAF